MSITAEKKIAEGYKLTEIGVIPEDWDSGPLGEIIRLQGGYSFSSSSFSDQGIPVVRISDIQNGLVNTNESVCHPEIALSENFKIKEGDVLLAMSGATTGKTGVYKGTHVAYQNQRVGRFVVKDKKSCSQLFVSQLVKSTVFQNRLKIFLEQGAQPNISGSQIESLLFAYPKTLDEQNAIGKTLSDADTLIENIKKLIEKKKNIKQGVMQELLTGKRRLAEFKDEWVNTSLGSISKIESGINKALAYIGKGTRYVTVLDLYEGSNIQVNKAGRIQVTAEEIIKYGLEKGDIIFGKSSVKRDGIGYPNIFNGHKEKVVFSGFTFRARMNIGVADPSYILYVLRTNEVRNWLISNSQSSALTNINQKIANGIPLYIPKNIREQNAIAEVLSCMDTEIEKLESQLSKYRNIKQGMMQVLLTGKVRLV